MALQFRKLDRKRERLTAEYGPPFPEYSRMIESIEYRKGRVVDFYVPGLVELHLEETCYLVCAELEKIVGRGTLPETAAAIEGVGQRISEAIAAAQQEIIMPNEELKRSEEDFFRRGRVWREKRERATAAQNPDPASPRRSEESAKDLDEKWRSDPRFQRAIVEE